MESKALNSTTNQIAKNLLITATIIVTILVCTVLFISPVKAATLTPNDTQYLEMRAKDINDVNGEKQLVFELWAHDIDFKGFDVRFKYDETKFEPSNISTNDIVDIDMDDFDTYFKYESEFESSFDSFAMVDSNATDTNVIRMIFSIDTPASDTEHIQGDTFISSGQDVLIGKMSFKMKVEPFDITGFSLVEDTSSSPTTGIKINSNVSDSYEAQSTFRFTDKTASKDATLKNIQISREVEDESNPGTMIDKDYPLDPVFDPTTKTYKLEILEYIDTMDLLAEKNDINATMKLKYPKRNIEKDPLTGEVTKDELVYGTPGDESTLEYDEINLADNTKQSIVLNKLGEPDTVLTIEVTAEDGTTKENYEITIHRPYGTIKGSIQLGENLRASTQNTYGIDLDYIAEIRAYKTLDVNWDDIKNETITFDDLDLIKPQYVAKSKADDGSYELLLIPGDYDIYMETKGFTQAVETKKTLKEGDTIDLGNHILYEGDVERNGIVDLNDMISMSHMLRSKKGDGKYSDNFDFHKKGMVDLNDLICVSKNLKLRKKINIK